MNVFRSITHTETEEAVETIELIQEQKQLLLYNDDVNTFEFVIDTLVEICQHNLLQAEQCAYLVHYSGKCVIKAGSFDKLEPLCTALLDRGLSAKIE